MKFLNIVLLFVIQQYPNEAIKNAIKQLNLYIGLIQRECENLEKSIANEDAPAKEAFRQQVRDCALNIASATKTLVLQFQ